MEWDKNTYSFVATDKGVPQGGIISPLLSNLVLHELDRFVDSLMLERERGNAGKAPHVLNPKYQKLSSRLKRLAGETGEGGRVARKKIRSLRNQLPRLLPNPDFVRFRYVRYADDWLMGI